MSCVVLCCLSNVNVVTIVGGFSCRNFCSAVFWLFFKTMVTIWVVFRSISSLSCSNFLIYDSFSEFSFDVFLLLMLMLMVFWFSKYILCNSLTKDCLYCFNLVVFDFVRLRAVKNYTVKWSCIVYQFVIANQRTDFLCFGCLRLFLSKFNTMIFKINCSNTHTHTHTHTHTYTHTHTHTHTHTYTHFLL